ncbi:MAG: hypothetical protein ACRD0G_06790 [Acidimicrobiales bacterium]
MFRIAVAGAMLGAFTLAPSSGSASPVKVTICHATGSASNPYVLITVSENAVREGKGHNRDGHQRGEDIIPPGPHDPDGRNWDAAGQTIYNDECLTFLPNVLPPSR